MGCVAFIFRCSLGYSSLHVSNRALKSQCPGVSFQHPPSNDLANPKYRVVSLFGPGPFLVTMSRANWLKFVKYAPHHEPPVCIIPPREGAPPLVTHGGVGNQNILLETFIGACCRAGISADDLEFSMAGQGCGEIPLQQGPFDKRCLLGSSRLALGHLEAMLKHDVLRGLNWLVVNSNGRNNTILMDVKSVFLLLFFHTLSIYLSLLMLRFTHVVCLSFFFAVLQGGWEKIQKHIDRGRQD